MRVENHEDQSSNSSTESGGVRMRPESVSKPNDAEAPPDFEASPDLTQSSRAAPDDAIVNGADVKGPASKTGGPAPSPSTQSATEDTDHDVLDANVGDQPTPEDTLGFEPYVKAIANFLTNEVTKPPLTLSIEGEWGSGKSSFMLQLQQELRADGSGIVLDFNAWRYDKDEAMWASFALKFTRQLANELPFIRRWLAHLKLFFLRFNWERGWRDIIKLVFMLLVLGGILLLPILAWDRIAAFVAPASQTATPPAYNLNGALRTLIGGGGALAYLALVVGLAVKAKNVVRNPLSIDLKQDLDTPDYKSRVAFIESFHEDFGKVVKAYARDKKVFVFIDDLDRCEVPKAADLMQALNLMISDSPRLIFIMGMDREKVAAGLAVKYEKLLPYLSPAPPANGGHNYATFDPIFGLEYGYNFIEKFIQLPFIIPQASEPQVQGFLDHIFGATDGGAVTQQPPPTLLSAQAGESAERIVTENSAMVTDILKMVAPTFDYNPRRLKQFINAFRLKTFIASRTGLFGPPDDPTKYNPLTTAQLGKFVAIGLHWPLLLSDLDAERDLLSRMQTLVLSGIPPSSLVTVSDRGEVLAPEIKVSDERKIEVTEALVRWYRRDNLRKLLRVKLFVGGRVDSQHEKTYSIERLDIDKLLQVSAVTKPSAQTTSAGGQTTNMTAGS
jgi:KAP family P-loop domain